MSPLEGQVHHIDYMSYIYHAYTGMKNWVPPSEVYHTGLKTMGNEERGQREALW